MGQDGPDGQQVHGREVSHTKDAHALSKISAASGVAMASAGWITDWQTHIRFCLKVGFHYPSSRAELTARELGCIFDTRQLGPSTRVVETDLYSLLPVSYTHLTLPTIYSV